MPLVTYIASIIRKVGSRSVFTNFSALSEILLAYKKGVEFYWPTKKELYNVHDVLTCF